MRSSEAPARPNPARGATFEAGSRLARGSLWRVGAGAVALVLLAAGPARPAERELSGILGAMANPPSLQLRLSLGWKHGLSGCDNFLVKGSHVAAGIGQTLSPAYGRTEAWVRIAPLSVLRGWRPRRRRWHAGWSASDLALGRALLLRTDRGAGGESFYASTAEGQGGGARPTRARWRVWSRIFFMTDGSVMNATTCMSAPHLGQSSGSTS